MSECKEKHRKEHWHWTGGDGVEIETYYCPKCDIDWEVPMEIKRYWSKSINLNEERS